MKTLQIFATILLCLCTAIPATAAGKADKQDKPDKKPSKQYDVIEHRHEVRLGIGGTAFERTFFPNSIHMSYTDRPSTASYVEKQSHSYLPHFFVEYDYTFLPWLTVGGQIDVGSFSWKNNTYKGGSSLIYSTEKQNCQNITIQALCRFNWLRRKYFGLYSGLGLGVGINTGTEVDIYGKHTGVGVAVTPVLIGCTGGAGHWFGSLEISGINSLRGVHELYLVGGRMISISATYKF